MIFFYLQFNLPFFFSAFGELAYIGGSKTNIQYRESKWRLYVRDNQIIEGVSSAGKESALLGTSFWNISGDYKCASQVDQIELNFHICDDKQFNCDNGQCIGIELRCDGTSDCKDNSDEAHCKTVLPSMNYNKQSGDTSTSNGLTEVTMSITLLNFLAINDNEGSIKIQFQVDMSWIDSRLTFFNLIDDETALSTIEESSIWKPIFFLGEVDLASKDEYNEREMMVVIKNQSYEGVPTKMSALHNELEFPGSRNPLKTIKRQR